MKIFKSKGSIRGATIYVIASIIGFSISIFSLPIYTRILTPTDFGISLIFVIFGKIVVGFVTFNLHFSTYRYYFELKDKWHEFKTLNSLKITQRPVDSFDFSILKVLEGNEKKPDLWQQSNGKILNCAFFCRPSNS